ncbi:MAG: hypothetical protein JW943_04630 [Deltaproteobacteria bacterium]|nr:hypothetical protein [Deltaproteobacteria bacterium]
MKKAKHQTEDDFSLKEMQDFFAVLKTVVNERGNIDILMRQKSIVFFNKDQINEYIKRLEPYANRQSILNFVTGIDFYCGEYSKIVERLTPEKKEKIQTDFKTSLTSALAADRRKKRTDFDTVIQNAKIVIARLKRISAHQDVVAYPTTVMDLAFMESPFGDGELLKEIQNKNQKVADKAKKATLSLIEFVEALEAANCMNAPLQAGRQKAGNDGIADIIAMFYGRYIGKPTHPHTGGFYLAVQLTFECLDLPHVDPDRRVKVALAKLRPVNSPKSSIDVRRGRAYAGYGEEVPLGKG